MAPKVCRGVGQSQGKVPRFVDGGLAEACLPCLDRSGQRGQRRPPSVQVHIVFPGETDVPMQRKAFHRRVHGSAQGSDGGPATA
ncbi:hypothetical protein [Mycobacterium interjectum]|uniref:hypothetical protein n=1 Tax=Mycobacterium interjectum TaxID=33895 RepID=UPI00082D6A4E|nr:hypothetical protein [Mycobacterium interjectum]